MALCPFAKHELIPPGSNDPRIEPRVAILHVAVSMLASLFRYFNGPSGGIESHFYINWRGKIIQYRDTGWQADANYLANDFAISIETAGWGSGRWNKRQLRAIKRLLTWLHETEGIPLQKCQEWDGSGVGYHIQFGSPGMWTNVSKSCPGPQRIKQFLTILVPWMNAGARIIEEDDMPNYRDWPREDRQALADDIAKAVNNYDAPVYDAKKGEERRVQVIAGQTHQRAGDARAAAREVLRGQADLARLIGDATLTEQERRVLANDIAARIDATVERIDAAELAEHLEITTKES